MRLREHANASVIGVWNRGRFESAGPETKIQAATILLLAGSRAQLDDYDALFCIHRSSDKPVVIIGGGRVGRSVARALKEQGMDSRIVERNSNEVRESATYVVGGMRPNTPCWRGRASRRRPPSSSPPATTT
ncbi:NAD-binding protein [Paludisphaera soli]|uniref:NAD-binding protein n=1 Tax=Paludisphaera soli TaxID=2712865 RepID=UPI0036F34B35